MGVVKNSLLRVGRLIGIASFTFVEIVALVVWLALVRAEPLGPASGVIGVSILFGGLLLEGLLTQVTVNGVKESVRMVAIVAFTTTETLLWVGWLALAERIGGPFGIGVAGLALAILLVPQHTVEDNVLRGEQALTRLFDSGTISFSVLEAAGATAWLLLVAGFVTAAPFLTAIGITVPAVVLPGGIAPSVAELLGIGLLTTSLFVEHVVGVRHALRTPSTDAHGHRTSVGSISFQQD